MEVLRSNFNPVTEFEKSNGKWIKEQIDDTGINYLENFGFYLCDKRVPEDRFPGSNALTTVQMRNIFGEIKRIEAGLDFPSKNSDDDERRGATEKFAEAKQHILLLRPKLAYNTARQLEKRRESRIKQFREVLEMAFPHINDQDQYKRFCQFVEGIVAYHKVYGGKDNANR